MSKKCTLLLRKAHFEVKMYKTHQVRNTFGSWDVEKVHVVVAQSTFQVKLYKTHQVRNLSHFQKPWQAGTFEEDLPRCISRGRRRAKDMFMRDVRRPGRWFPERGCILEHPICRFAKMILHDRCSTSYDLASIFRGRRNTLDRWSGKIANAYN